MKNDSETKKLESNCKEIEMLLYLQNDELTPAEAKTLKQHLEQCPACQSDNDFIQHQHHKIRFEPNTESSEHLIETIQNRIDNLPEQALDQIKPWIFQKPVQRILAAACILFFVVFSVEQVSTISRISKLETRVQKKSQASSLQYQKGELLVINHFISREELRKVATRHLKIGANVGFLPRRMPISQWSLWQQGLTAMEKNNFINDLLNHVPANIPLLRIGKITNINSDRINSLLQNY